MGQLSNKTIMALNIKRLLRLKGERTSALSRAINTPYTTVAEWVNGQPLNTLSNLLWFGCAAISARI